MLKDALYYLESYVLIIHFIWFHSAQTQEVSVRYFMEAR